MARSERSSDTYVAYSLTFSVDAELPCEAASVASTPEVTVRAAADRSLTHSAPRAGVWFQHDSRADGSEVLRWGDTYECWVSRDGRSIRYTPLSDASSGAFLAYVLSSALSFSLLKLGKEHLHATCVVVDGQAFGFLGQPGDGKSTLAASFLDAGHQLLTDDLLVLADEGGQLLSYPGLPRIKLMPEAAKRVFPTADHGVPMNRTTSKLVLPVAHGSFSNRPLPLRRLYVLDEGRSISVRELSSEDAFLALTEHTYNAAVADRARLEQHLEFVERVYGALGVSVLRFPRDYGSLAEVRSAILRDLAA
jgi:hypothetical protein